MKKGIPHHAEDTMLPAADGASQNLWHLSHHGGETETEKRCKECGETMLPKKGNADDDGPDDAAHKICCL
jgi:hypothetical protein